MGIRERKKRHSEDLQQLILDAARNLFIQEGYEATSIRRIASAIEFSPTIIYFYYKDKSDVFQALQKEGFRLLGSSFAVLNNVENPFERLKAIGRCYLQFAFDNPRFYELMFVMKVHLYCLEKDIPEGYEGEANVFKLLLSTLEDCKRSGYFMKQDLYNLSTMVWAQVHGLITLYLQSHPSKIIENKISRTSECHSKTDAVFGSFIQLLAQMNGGYDE